MNIEKQIVECVPNFSEGRDMNVVRQITDAISSVEGVSLLNVDPGEATNRTVVTFVGEASAVVEAAFRGACKAGEVIDMRRHHGAHPRMGATDVLPLIPVSGITLEECGQLARQLAQRLAREAGIPCYCYEAAALRPERKNLAVCRAGEYEALEQKLTQTDLMPDYMPDAFSTEQLLAGTSHVLQTGCTAVGARDFLIAVNFNLNTTSARRANAIAFDVREKGRPMREGNPITGPILRDGQGRPMMQPGTLKATKAIGWYIDEYGIAQVSMNMTNLSVTPLHVAFDEVCRCAQLRGLRVTGTEIVGLVPKKALVDAGKYFLEKQHRSVGVPEEDIVKIAVKSMGLDDLRPFHPREKVIEYLMDDATAKGPALADLTVRDFAHETSRESPAPGGGTIAAYMGTLAAALGTMVANLSAHKAGWDDRWAEFSQWAAMGQEMVDKLLRLVDEDTAAFRRLMAAYALPKKTEAEQAIRAQAIEEATLHAAEVPLSTMHAAMQTFVVCRAMAHEGLAASVSDAGVGAIAARAAVAGAALNVKINAAQLKDSDRARQLAEEADALVRKADEAEREVVLTVEQRIKTDK